MSAVHAWLHEAGLGDYAELFALQGYDELELLRDLTPEETEEMALCVGMRRGHLLKFRRRCLGPAQGQVPMPVLTSPGLAQHGGSSSPSVLRSTSLMTPPVDRNMSTPRTMAMMTTPRPVAADAAVPSPRPAAAATAHAEAMAARYQRAEQLRPAPAPEPEPEPEPARAPPVAIQRTQPASPKAVTFSPPPPPPSPPPSIKPEDHSTPVQQAIQSALQQVESELASTAPPASAAAEPAAPSPVRAALESAVSTLEVACSGAPRDHRKKLRELVPKS